MDEQAHFVRAVEGFSRRVHAATPEQWAAPTPCAEWSVRDLVNHLIGEMVWLPLLLEGLTIAEVGDRFDGDLTGDDPLAAWDGASAAAASAVTSLGDGSREVHLSYGDVPAARYVEEVSVDLLVHSWDLARAIGADETLDPDLVRLARVKVEAQADALASSGLFGPPVPVAEDADEQTRLLAATGRRA